MAKLNALMKDTAIYGLSSIVGRFLNYLLVPLYTHYMPRESGDYGVSTNIYAYVALIMALLGVDALGVNCSAGPADLQPVVREMLRVAPRPVIVQANAGLPEVVDGVTTYTLPPADYAAAVVPMIEAGASVVGGCCGTNPDYIREEAGLLTDRAVQPRSVDDGQALALAREAADEGGRDGDIIALILEAADTAALKDALIEEFDLDW